MSKVNECKGNIMSAQEVSIFSLKADQQLLELVTPGEAALGHKAPFVGNSVKEAFAPALSGFATAWVFLDVRDQAVIKAGFARLWCHRPDRRETKHL
jgi:hypothetical protein